MIQAASIIGIDYYFPDSVGSSFAHDPNLANEIPHLLSVDQLLESVSHSSMQFYVMLFTSANKDPRVANLS